MTPFVPSGSNPLDRRRRKPTRALAPALAVLVLALATPTPAFAAEDGKAACAHACAGCHRSAVRLVARYALISPEDRRMALEDLLRGHHAPDPAERAQITAFLEAQLRKR